jgi:hypothetical protein
MNGELGLIIDEMGQAMWTADRGYMATVEEFTPRMKVVWAKYVSFCRRYSRD